MVTHTRISWMAAAVMVSATCLAQSPTVTRFEQSDPRIAYTGTWYPNSDAPNSGGSAVLANLKGSQAVVTFNGTGITWIGESDGYSGLCYLTLDGVQTTVDTGSTTGTTLYQQPLFAVHGLAAGLL